MSKRVETLLESICGPDHPLADRLRRWCLDSRPFLAFVEAHQSKIRKKVRHAQTEEQRGDVLAELAVAFFWLTDRRFEVRYEAHKASGQRSNDLEVMFKTHTPLQVEVTRLRLTSPVESEVATRRLVRALCEKITQFAGGQINLLVVVVPPEALQLALLPSALRLLDRASANPSEGLQPASVQAFQRGRPRLSAAVLCAFDADWQAQAAQLWLGGQAKQPLPPEVTRFLERFGTEKT